DILRTECCVREHCDLVRLHLEGATADEKKLLLSVGSLHAHFAGFEQGQERRVPGSDAELALGCGREHHRGRAGENLALSTDDVDMNGVSHRVSALFPPPCPSPGGRGEECAPSPLGKGLG